MMNNIPPVVKNLLIINILFFLAQEFLPNGYGDMLTSWLGLHAYGSGLFYPYQFVTYMFLHANFMHLFTNMFGLFMFGRILEESLGGKRFLILYMVSGIGAALLNSGVTLWELSSYKQSIIDSGYMGIIPPLDIATIGASGAIFGILAAFAMLFPDVRIMLLIPPIPMKAKYFVIIYGVIELAFGFTGTNSSVAHFAHVGGLLFGYLLIKYWRGHRRS